MTATWVCPSAIHIHLTQLLHPGVLVAGPKGNRWQRFVYENLNGVCLKCGMFHLPMSICAAVGDGAPAKLQPDNIDNPVPQPLPAGDGWSKIAKIARRRSPLWLSSSKQVGVLGLCATRGWGFDLLEVEEDVPANNLTKVPRHRLKDCLRASTSSHHSKRPMSPVHSKPKVNRGSLNLPRTKLVAGTKKGIGTEQNRSVPSAVHDVLGPSSRQGLGRFENQSKLVVYA